MNFFRKLGLLEALKLAYETLWFTFSILKYAYEIVR